MDLTYLQFELIHIKKHSNITLEIEYQNLMSKEISFQRKFIKDINNALVDTISLCTSE